MSVELMKAVEQSSLKTEVPQFEIGDTVDVHTRILEGSKERIQIFSGVVIARRGHGTAEMFTVRRIVQGEGVERTFPVNTPKISHIEVKRHARVRRAKLFYLRERTGKATRLRERKSKPWESDPNAKKKQRSGKDIGSYGTGRAIINAQTGSGFIAYDCNNISLKNLNFIGDGFKGVFVWGREVEVGAFPTSYIKTTASQVTRSADSASMTGTNFSDQYRQDEGSIYAEYNSVDTIGFQ